MQASSPLSGPRDDHLPSDRRPVRRAAGADPTTYERVLMALGDCTDLPRAIASVEGLVTRGSGQVRVVHYRTWHLRSAGASAAHHDVFNETRETALDLTSETIDRLRQRGIRADGLMLQSPPGGLGALIDATARDWHAEVIVLADESAGEAISDEIQDEIAHGAPCPLLIRR